MKTKKVLISFNAGKLSPLLDIRYDMSKYEAGCRQMENFIPSYFGAARFRAGTKFISSAVYIGPESIDYPAVSLTGLYTVQWSSCGDDILNYTLQRTSDDGQNWVTVQTSQSAEYEEFIGTSGVYKYRVRANYYTGSSQWTYGHNCTVALDLIDNLDYPPTSKSGSFTINWGEYEQADYYVLEQYTGQWSAAYSGQDNFYQETNLPSGTYRYRVKAVIGEQSIGWTYGSYCRVLRAPQEIDYPSTSSSGTIDISWTSDSSAVYYTLEYSDDGGQSYYNLYNGSNPFYSDVRSLGSYRYRVKSVNYYLESDWTEGTWDAVIRTPRIYAAGFLGSGKNLRLYTISDGNALLIADMLVGSVGLSCAAASPDGNKLVVGSLDGKVYSIKPDLSGINWTYSLASDYRINAIKVDNSGTVFVGHDTGSLEQYANLTKLNPDGTLDKKVTIGSQIEFVYSLELNGNNLWVGTTMNNNGLFICSGSDLEVLKTINTGSMTCGLTKDSYGNIYAVRDSTTDTVKKFLSDGTYKNAKSLPTYVNYPITPVWSEGVLCLPLAWTSGSVNNPNVFFITAAADGGNMNGTVLNSFDFDNNQPSVASAAYSAACTGGKFFVGGSYNEGRDWTIVKTNSDGSGQTSFANTASIVKGLIICDTYD